MSAQRTRAGKRRWEFQPCEAAASLLLRVRKWSALRAWALRIAKRSSMLCAITAVARKLASILHRMWVSETDFHVGFGAKSRNGCG
jgi:transposase